MAEQFKAGDVVQLKSGGPLMTVTSANNASGNITVVWFNNNENGGQRLESNSIEREALQHYG